MALEKVPAEQAAIPVAPKCVVSSSAADEVARKPAGVAKQPVLAFTVRVAAEGA